MMNKQKKSLPARQLWLIIGLIILSTALFVLGVSLERQLEANENSDTHAESVGESSSEEAHEEAETNAENRESEVQEHSEESETDAEIHAEETILGINLENPWLIAVAVLAWIVLALALLCFGYPVLYLIILAALSMGILDVLEFIRQLNAGHSGIAFVAALVAALHLWQLFHI